MKVQWCKKHPNASHFDFRYDKTDDRFICRLCRSEVARNNYVNNKQKIKERCKKYREANPDRILKYRENERIRLIGQLSKKYIEGIDGTIEDNANGIVLIGIIDFIDSRVGTPFQGNGFRNLTYTFREGHTANTVADELLSIIYGTW